ncbi:AraC family transcriptional regulator [Amycolatopsis pithecellobii]|uniref:Helix-turn-helix domain-containing protein n=1 Tax=Amycolatopsis pithecellobii TaxID=664692 RepID=A0A6N7Z022_9PSEU|nr:AraC family transcriptional regulator [Amycolatopsis pithecellobii]MTD53091.1 helix-turn-helix domain-containing protein [Amycolatopsis pithecellobii]
MECSNVYRSSSAEVTLDTHDPIRDALALARPHTVAPVPLRATAPWGARFSPFPHIKLGVIVEGECWLCIDGLEPLFLSTGDFYLLGNPPPYGLGSSIEAARARDSKGPRRKEISASGPEISQGSVTYTCTVDFEFQDSDASTLFSSLPPAVLVKADDTDGRLLWNIATILVHEMGAHKAGRSLVLEHLAQILLVHMLRSHAGSSQEPLGWLASVSDDGIGAALRAIHAEPGDRWTLEELAKIAMMSRSAFAVNFRNRVGRPPLDYLIEWRMQLARAALRTEDSLTAIAAAIGYQSESAFSTAFRRVVGMSPREFRVSLHAQPRDRAEA